MPPEKTSRTGSLLNIINRDSDSPPQILHEMERTAALESTSAASFSLVIPAYNEENRLDGHNEVFEFVRSHFATREIIYVDDGSSDKTLDVLRERETLHPDVKVLRHDKNYGKGRAVRTGLEAARGDIVLFSDADFSTPIQEVKKMFPLLTQGYDIVIGSRGVTGANVEVPQSGVRETIGKIGNAIVQSLLLLPFEDTQCGFKLYTSRALGTVLPQLTIDGFAFDMEMLVVAAAAGLRVAEMPVTWRNVQGSKVRGVHNVQVLKDLLSIRYNSAVGKYS